MVSVDRLSREKASSLLQEHAAPRPTLTLTEAPAHAGVARFAARLWTPLYATAFYLWVNAAGAALAGFIFWALAARIYDAGELGRGSAALSTLMLIVGVRTPGRIVTFGSLRKRLRPRDPLVLTLGLAFALVPL